MAGRRGGISVIIVAIRFSLLMLNLIAGAGGHSNSSSQLLLIASEPSHACGFCASFPLRVTLWRPTR